MLYDQRELKRNIAYVYDNFTVEIPKPVKDQFFALVTDGLCRLHEGYTEDFAPAKNVGQFQLKFAYNYLKHHYQLQYLRSIAGKELQDKLVLIAYTAFLALGLSDYFVLPLLHKRKYEWERILLEQFANSDLNWPNQAHLFADFVAVDFAKHISLYSNADIYTQFREHLSQQLIYFRSQLEAETDIELMIIKVKQHAPQPYRTVPLPTQSLLNETHPLNMLRFFQNYLFGWIPGKLTDSLISQQIAPLLPKLREQQEKLSMLPNMLATHAHAENGGYLTINSLNLLVTAAMRETFIMRTKISHSYRGNANALAQSLLLDWFRQNGYAEIEDLVLTYDNSCVIHRAAMQIHTKIMQAIDQYLRFPRLVRFDATDDMQLTPSNLMQSQRTPSPELRG